MCSNWYEELFCIHYNTKYIYWLTHTIQTQTLNAKYQRKDIDILGRLEHSHINYGNMCKFHV